MDVCDIRKERLVLQLELNQEDSEAILCIEE